MIQTDNLVSNCHTFNFPLLCRLAVNNTISNTIDLLKQIWFPLARKDSQIEGFDQDNIIDNTMSDRQENATVNEGTVDQEFTVNNSGRNSAANENLVKVRTLERCFNERIDKEMGNIVDTDEDRIQNAILTAIDSIITPKTELAIRSINASSGRNVSW